MWYKAGNDVLHVLFSQEGHVKNDIEEFAMKGHVKIPCDGVFFTLKDNAKESTGGIMMVPTPVTTLRRNLTEEQTTLCGQEDNLEVFCPYSDLGEPHQH